MTVLRLYIIISALFLWSAATPVPTFGKKNIIFMVPDGFGPSGLTMARDYRRTQLGLANDQKYTLNLDPFIIGSIRTKSNSSLITDSAAAATTYATGFKTYNGGISVDSSGTAKTTLMESLKSQGYKTGLVVKSTLTDATPGVWAAHVSKRDKQSQIAEQMLEGGIVDYMSGGGKCYWIPKSETGSCREDDRNLITEAKDRGFTYFESRSEFDGHLAEGLSLPALSFWAQEDVDYAIDYNNSITPTLPEQALLALKTLEKATEYSTKGFFVLIEGSLIDHCGHDNDAACHTREVLEFDETFKVVKDFIDGTDTETIVVVTADHETGGLTLGLDDSSTYYPEVLFNKTHSSLFFESKVIEFNETNPQAAELTTFVQNWVATELAVTDASDEEIQTVVDAVTSDGDIRAAIGPITSNRASIGWSTGSHTASDIFSFFYTNSQQIQQNVFNNEPGWELRGSHENVEINRFLRTVGDVAQESSTSA
ncbi:vacuolar alkaline phosphatase [Yamadazyma tenuis]|uniref:Alkaline phosphatase n=1 Tax=Candida tenuis (strain ATCC 10573 / BCRC 21748 / CBS 615 / JCM 9827 / NBRC 10315 / NRRL Y-1498 / VKM Y-70) TaxID=590646 RepID=G3B7P7_CANTC|nr:uncharacterized protein CANTEDRAFT_131656 [Yamadazyma tenuis ATCC 10573]EGV62291.1 hypothetical protein CANTEDRAFT_131656 [Yamadazyma tenuis ATCC 10573]WEJ93544.1 vacuolar alkaline phosphatase [Yamadazyma tenuis]